MTFSGDRFRSPVLGSVVGNPKQNFGTEFRNTLEGKTLVVYPIYYFSTWISRFFYQSPNFLAELSTLFGP